jgi:G:T-mismatch repair DNA endonuclease (very short patch repair protein)
MPLPLELAKNASILHKRIGELLVELYPNYEIRQEYPVYKVNSSFKSKKEKFDWVVLSLNIVIEVHGEQHYKPVCFGGITKTEAKYNYRKNTERDFNKEQAAINAGWSYVVIDYKYKKITKEELLSIINLIERNRIPKQNQEVKKKYNWEKGKKIQSKPFPKKRVKSDSTHETLFFSRKFKIL